MTAPPRLLVLGALALLLGACDSGAPSAPAAARAAAPTASTVVAIDPGGANFAYEFLDDEVAWDGSFTATSLDAQGAPIVTFRQQRRSAGTASKGAGSDRYTIDFSWRAGLGDAATIEYLAIAADGTRTVLHGEASVDGDGGESSGPGRSYHTKPDGETRIDYPKEGDPADEAPPVETPSGVQVQGVTDVALRLPPEVKMPQAVAVRFTYPQGVALKIWATPAPGGAEISE